MHNLTNVSVTPGTQTICNGLSIDGTLMTTSSITPPYIFNDDGNNSITIGINDNTLTESDIYIIESWQSKSPLEIGNGLFVSLKSDLYTYDEIKEKITEKIKTSFPEKMLQINIDKLCVKKYSPPIEISIN